MDQLGGQETIVGLSQKLNERTVELVKQLLKLLSHHISDMCLMKMKKIRILDNLKERAGVNWRTSKFRFVINCLETSTIQINDFH